MKFNFNAIAIRPGGRLFPKILLVMKLTTLIILIAFMQVSAKTYSQITLHVNNKPLTEVLETVKKQTGYVFFYEGHLLDNIKVSVDVNNVQLKEAMDKCLTNLPLSYEIVKKNVVITQKSKLAQEPTNGESSALIKVNGKVTDTTGTPLIGATISIKGSQKKTITNEAGDFTISVKAGDVLSISFIGFKPVEITVTEKTTFLAIALLPGINGLKEVVVNTGFQTLPAERATGSFAIVDNTLFNRRTSPDVLSRLEGVVPGLIVNRNVSTNNTTNGIDISIQGVNTLFSNAQPLIVVDNFPYDGNISNINPNDVESITILKDAAAASIWGVQSGNGVIVITTKKGHRNQALKIEANANLTVGARPNLFYSPDFLDSKDFIGVEKFLFSKGFYDSRLTDPTHPVVSPLVQLLADERAGKITDAEATAQINSLASNDVRNDISKYFYQKSVAQQYALSFRGGGNNNDFNYSVGYDNNLSNQVGNKNDRLTLRGLNNFYPFKNFQIMNEVSYTLSNSTNNSQVGNLTVYPYLQLADKNGNALAIPKDYNYSWITDPVAQSGLLNWQYKPLEEQRLADNTSKISDTRIVTNIKYVLPFGLTASLLHQYERSETSGLRNDSQDSYFARNLINKFTNLSGNPEYPVPIGGILSQNYLTLNSNRFRGQLNYDLNWNSKNSITAIAGAEIDESNSNTIIPPVTYGYNESNGSTSAVDFVTYFPTIPNLSRGQIPGGNGSYYTLTNRFISYFSNAAYSYDDKYILSLSGRIDKSNLFGVATNQKAAPLYSAGFSWNLNKEDFFHFDLIPLIRLRATYGYNGNLNNSATAVTTIRAQSNAVFSGVPYAVIASPGNPELRWERDRKINFGLDFASKNSRVTGSFDYYLKRDNDLFGNISLPPSTGLSSIYGNTATIKGQGFDLVLNVEIVNNSRFRWISNFNISRNLDKVVKYDAQSSYVYDYLVDGAGVITPRVGSPLFAIYSFRTGTLTHDTGDPQGYLNGKLSTNYSAIIQNTTIDSLKLNGSARPTTYGSLMNTFFYKKLSLSFNIIYKLDYYFRRTSINYYNLFQNGVGNSDFSKRWQKPGDEQFTTVPSMPSNATEDPNRETIYLNSQNLVDNGDHIRLQDVSLNYEFDNPKIFKGAFSKINLYIYMNNVGILWRANKDHLDPDLYTSYPIPRTISMGIKTSF